MNFAPDAIVQQDIDPPLSGYGGGAQDPQIAINMREEVKRLYEDARQNIYSRQGQWIQNAAFYRGHQWGVATELGYLPDIASPYEDREKYNYIRPFVRTAVADILSHIPNPEVVAAADDQESVARAEAANRLVRSFVWNGVLNWEQLYKCELAAQIFGGAWLKVYWDPNTGRETRKYRGLQTPDGQVKPDLDPFGVQRYDSAHDGEIAVRAVDPIDALPDPHARTRDEIRHVFHRKLIPRGTLNDRFETDVFGQSTRDKWATWSAGIEPYERDSISRDYDYSLYWPHQRAPENELCELVEFWEKPTRMYPGGRLVVFSGNIIIAMGPLPYDFPWVLRNGANVMHSELYADGMIYDLAPLQRTLNLTVTKVREWMDRILNPGIMAPRGAQIKLDEFSNIAGWVASYNFGYKPEWMDVPQIPQSMFTHADTIREAMKDISTYSDVSRGEVPQGIESGRAMAYIDERQRGVHGPDVHSFRLTVLEVLQKCLKLARTFYADGRMLTVLGEDNAWAQHAFRKEDYEVNDTLVIEPFSGAPESRAIRESLVMEAFGQRLFDDDPGAERARKLLRLDTHDRDANDPDQGDRAEARAENYEFIEMAKMGVPAQLEAVWAENHDIHLEEHSRVRRGKLYKSLPPELRAAIDGHAEAHEMFRAQQIPAYSSEMQMLDPSGVGGAPPQILGGGPQEASPGFGPSEAEMQNTEQGDVM